MTVSFRSKTIVIFRQGVIGLGAPPVPRHAGGGDLQLSHCPDVKRTSSPAGLLDGGAAELPRMETPSDEVHRQRVLASSAPVFHPL